MTKKKISFIVIIVSLPIFIFVLLEAILLSINYDESAETVITIERNGKKYYTINQLVGKKYFNKTKLYYRKGQHDFFEVEKSNNTIRIFCFGASTTAGFPYEYNAIPTEFLHRQLEILLPNKNIEVINTAIAATNSFTVFDLEKDLIKYKPDMFIVYMGQNEFYGAFGVGSSISLGENRSLIKAHLWLHKFRSYLLIKNIIAYILGNNDEKENISLMEDMIQNNAISLNNETYLTAKETFKKNYEEIIELAKKNNIPIILSTLVTNEKDLSPFVSLHKKNIDKSNLTKFTNLYDSGVENFKNENYKDAINYFKQVIEIDSTFAKAHFYLGKCYTGINDYGNAKKEFVLANDFDGLKFRAPSEFNSIIIKLSKKYKVPLSDIYSLFNSNSPNNIIGKELLIDHLHPNIKGYFLLSKAWLNTIKHNYLLDIKPTEILNEKSIFQNIPVTELDSTIGEMKIISLKSKPPFKSRNKNFVIKPKNFIEEQAYRLTIKKDISWGIAHINVAKYYFKKNYLHKAIKELQTLLVTDQTNPNVHAMIGDAFFRLKNYKAAEESYLKVYKLTNDFAIMERLGIIELKLNKPSNAIVLFENCINHYSNSKSNSNIEEIHLNLALAYYRTNNQLKAKNELDKILEKNPHSNEAFNLLKKIESDRNQKL